MEEVIVSQPSPGPSPNTGSSPVYASGPVTVRNLTDTPEDGAFAGALLVEGFRGKFIHASSERSLPKVIECTSKDHRNQPSIFYERTFVAEYNGEKAGVMTLKYHGDPTDSGRGEYSTLGCCESSSLRCLISSMEAEEVPEGKCYLDHICVDEKFRGKGIGKVLLNFAESEGKKRGCHTIYLWVTYTNRAIHLYERQGYVIQGTVTWCCFIWCIFGERSVHRMEKPLQ